MRIKLTSVLLKDQEKTLQFYTGTLGDGATSHRKEDNMQRTSGYVDVNGIKMYYEIHGQGTPETVPLVVLHGAYMNIPSMGAIIPRLAETHKVYALEFQGHGRTTDIDRPITYPNLADDVAAFMDAVGLAKADVFGYSMGAGAGLQLAIRHPEKVNKLIAASVAYDAEGWQPEFKAFIPQMTVEMFVNMPFAEDYRKLAANPEGFPELVKKLIQLEKEPMAWEKDVRAMKTPVLIICGDADGCNSRTFCRDVPVARRRRHGRHWASRCQPRASPSCRRLRTPPLSPRPTCCLASSNLS